MKVQGPGCATKAARSPLFTGSSKLALALLLCAVARVVSQSSSLSNPDQLPANAPFFVQSVADRALCWAIASPTISCTSIRVQPCADATSRTTFYWRSSNPRYSIFPTLFSPAFGYFTSFLFTINARVNPCATGSVVVLPDPNGGSSLSWELGGPMSSRDWDPTLCVEQGTAGWIWWAPCDGSARQRWAAVFPGPSGASPPNRAPPPPLPPSPPPPPPGSQLSLTGVAVSSSTAVVTSLADFRAAARDLSKTEFLVSSPLIWLDGSPLNLTRRGVPVRIAGPPCTLWTGSCPRLSGVNLSAIFTVVADSFELTNVELVDGVSATDGGVVSAVARLSVSIINVGFSRCESAGGGGAVFITNPLDIRARGVPAVATIVGTSFRNVTSFLNGGGVSILNGNGTITSCTFRGCSAGQRAGCLIADNPSLELAGRLIVESSTFDSSTAAVLGGTIMAESLIVRSCNFSNSESYSDGGFIWVNGYMSVSDSTFLNGFTHRNGGCLAGGAAGITNGAGSQTQAVVEVTRCSFTNCVAQNAVAWMATRNFYSFLILGGAICSSLDMVVQSSVFRHCHASAAGGALFSMRSLSVSDSSFFNTSSGSFGGTGAAGNFQATPGDITVNRTNVTLSSAALDGGAFFAENNLFIQESRFLDVSADRSGGALFSYRQGARGPDGGVLSVTSSSFTNVRAARLGGAVYGSGKLTRIVGCVFRNTSGQLGGAVHASQDAVLEATQFIGISAAFGGGSVKGGSVVMRSCTFSDSTARLRGGSVLAVTLSATDCEFHRSTAGTSGGAIFVDRSAVVASSRFDRCTATDITGNFLEGGGAIATSINGAEEGGGGRWDASIAVSNCTFSAGRCPRGWGGALQSHNINATRCRFINNSALVGGAISGYGSGLVTVSDSDLIGNSAIVSGGGIQITSSGTAAALVTATIERTLFLAGAASQGGAFAAAFAEVTLADCRLVNNSALAASADVKAPPAPASGGTFVVSAVGSDTVAAGAGGGIFAHESSAAVVSSLLSGNRAVQGGAAYVAGRGASLIMRDAKVLRNAAAEGGGGILSSNASVVHASRTEFVGNAALNGGALFVEQTGIVRLDSVNASANRASLNGGVLLLAHNARTSLADCAFVGNLAAAGAVAYLHAAEPPPPCLVLGANGRAGAGCSLRSNAAERYGQITATEVVRATVIAPSHVRSGASLDLAVTLEDGYGNIVSGWPEMVSVAISGTNITLEGQKTVSYKRPGQGFSGLALLGEANTAYPFNVTSQLAFQPNQPVRVALSVSVRLCGGLEAFDSVLNRCACSPGSERLFSGDCACVPDFHVFTNVSNVSGTVVRADVTCRLCPRSSVCSGGLLAPADGFWHSSPESEDFRLCPNPRACTGGRSGKSTRAEELLDFQRRALQLQAAGSRPIVSVTELIVAGAFSNQAYLELQCSEGYTGPLCAACSPGFGRRRSVDCIPCGERSTILFSYFVILAFNAFGLFIALRTSLLQSRRRHGSFPPLMSQVIKILLSYLMCTSLILRVQSSWPQEVAQMLSLASLLGLTVDVVSIECIVQPNLFFTKLLGYVLVLPAGALVSYGLICLIYPLRSAYDDLAEMERAFSRWRGEPLRRLAALMLMGDGAIPPLIAPPAAGGYAAKVAPAPPEDDEKPAEVPQEAKGKTGTSPGSPEPGHDSDDPRPVLMSVRADASVAPSLQQTYAEGAAVARAHFQFRERLRHILQLSPAEAADLLALAPGSTLGAHDGDSAAPFAAASIHHIQGDDTEDEYDEALPGNGFLETTRPPARIPPPARHRSRPLRLGTSEHVTALDLGGRLWFVQQEGEASRMTWAHLVNVHVAVNVIVIFFLWLPITMGLLELFSCTLIDTEEMLRPLPSPFNGYWLVQDISQRCFRGKHYRYVVTVGVIGLTLISVGMPVAAAILTARLSKTQLRDRNVITRFGFLFFGYRSRWTYWESVVALRKALVVITAVFAGAGTDAWTSPKLALLLVIGVLCIAMTAQVLVRPHAIEALNRFEFLSLLCTTITCVFGIFYSTPGLPREVERVLTVAIVAFNASLVVFAVVYLLWTFILFRVSLSEMTMHIASRSGDPQRPEKVVLQQLQLIIIEQGWLRVTYDNSRSGRISQWLVAVLVWFLESKQIADPRGAAAASLESTRRHLNATVSELARRQAQRELQRRAALVCTWVAHGLVSGANSEAVAAFEARGRDPRSALLAEVARAGAAYSAHLATFRALPRAAQLRLLASPLPRMPGEANPLSVEALGPAMADLEDVAETLLSRAGAGAGEAPNSPHGGAAQPSAPAEAQQGAPAAGLLRRLVCAASLHKGGVAALPPDAPEATHGPHDRSAPGGDDGGSAAALRYLVAGAMHVRLRTLEATVSLVRRFADRPRR